MKILVLVPTTYKVSIYYSIHNILYTVKQLLARDGLVNGVVSSCVVCLGKDLNENTNFYINLVISQFIDHSIFYGSV